MGDVFGEIGIWLKKGFFVLTALAIAGLNLMMLLDVFRGDILFVILGMIFFSIATWVYLVTAFSATDKSSGIQVSIAWVGLVLSLAGELTMGAFEILRIQSFIAAPPWVNMVTIIVIECAIIMHLLLGIVYFAAGQEYNQRLHRIFESTKRAKAEESIRKSRAAAEIKIHEDATTQGVELTRSMLEAALPIVAERKARQMAEAIAKTFGLDGDPSMNRAFDQAISDYRNNFTTKALQAGDNEVLPGKMPELAAAARSFPLDVNRPADNTSALIMPAGNPIKKNEPTYVPIVIPDMDKQNPANPT